MYLLLEVLKRKARETNIYASITKLNAFCTAKICSGKYRSAGVKPTPAKKIHAINMLIAPIQEQTSE